MGIYQRLKEKEQMRAGVIRGVGLPTYLKIQYPKLAQKKEQLAQRWKAEQLEREKERTKQRDLVQKYKLKAQEKSIKEKYKKPKKYVPPVYFKAKKSKTQGLGQDMSIF